MGGGKFFFPIPAFHEMEKGRAASQMHGSIKLKKTKKEIFSQGCMTCICSCSITTESIEQHCIKKSINEKSGLILLWVHLVIIQEQVKNGHNNGHLKSPLKES